MKTVLTIIMAVMTSFTVMAYKYSYTFSNTPISEAIVKICKEHADVNISFIYKELGNYRTSARVQTDDVYEALQRTIGLNPISVVKKNNNYYIEALQHGKYCYTGKVVSNENEPISGLSVMLLAPKDSIVITYGITDDDGHFSIPCDRQGVIGKFSCLGYKTTYSPFTTFSVGTIVMDEQAIPLDVVMVESDYARLYSDKSVYMPTAQQKNSSQTAQDLINRMAIPQLRIGDEIKTTTGQSVDIFIDYMPATSGEMDGIRIEDVKRVEYYDYPIDPRFQGRAHVVNFIMQRYEYGGYVKGIYYDNFVFSRQLNGYAKIQYKKMTIDWAGGAFYMDDHRNYENTFETFRLPQADGSIKEFVRSSITEDSKKRRDAYWTSLKALYRNEKVAVSNMITADFDRTPDHVSKGKVAYTPEDYNGSEYSSQSRSPCQFIYL